MSSEQQQVFIKTGSLESVERRTEAETKAMRDSGGFPYVNKTREKMLTISASQLAGTVPLLLFPDL